MSDKTCLGIDIGNSRTKIAVRVRGRIRKVITADLPEDLIKDGRITSYEAFGDFLKATLKAEKVTVKDAKICMLLRDAYVRRATMPMMNIQQLKVNLPYEFHDFITEDMDKYVYDYSVLPSEDGDEQLHLLAVAAPKSQLEAIMNAGRRAKLKITQIAPVNVPISQVLRQYEKARGIEQGTKDIAFLGLGNSSVRLHFFTKGEYEMTRSMDLGVGAAVSRIMEETGQDRHIAHISFVNNTNDIQNAPYLQEVYGEISAQILRTLNFYSFNNRNNNLEELVCFGGGSLVEPLMTSLRENLPLKLICADEVLREEDRTNPDEDASGLIAIGMTLPHM